MNTKIKTALLVVIAAMLIFVTCGTAFVFADDDGATQTESDLVTVTEEFIESADDADTDGGETEPAEDETTEDETTEDETSIEEVAATFVEYLKATFGEDYTTYYNAIIDGWGTVEEYLLSFGDEVLPEQFQTGWQAFVSWLGEYAPVWAPVLAIAIVIIVYIIGKKRFQKIVQSAVDSKISALGEELNKQDKATTAILHSVTSLLGTSEKFADNVKELEESEKELNS